MDVAPQNGPQVTQRLMLRGTMDLLRGLATARFMPPLADAIGAWLDDVQRVAERRNFVVHSAWVSVPQADDPAPPGDATFHKLSMKKMRNRIDSIALSELRDLRDETDRLIARGTNLWFEIAAAQGR
jgi:hypothetical protein